MVCACSEKGWKGGDDGKGSGKEKVERDERQSLILNQFPLPSYSLAFPGALDINRLTGPWWYTA